MINALNVYFIQYNFFFTDSVNVEDSKTKSKCNRCSDCFSEIARGKPHKCSTSTRVENMKALLAKSSPQVQNQIISSALKTKITTYDQRTVYLNQQHGHPLKIVINPQKSTTESIKKPVITTTVLKKIQTKYGLSQNVTTGIASDLRVATKNRKFIEPNLKQNLSISIHLVDSFFATKDYEFKKTKGKEISEFKQTAVYCKDLNDLIEFIKEKRNVSNVRLKFGIDGGGGSLKICMSIQSDESELEPSPKKRQKYSEEVASKSFQDSGVKKLIILGLVQNVQESYGNVKDLWSDIGIDSKHGKVAADLKLCNIMAGIMPASSSYPCTWCEVPKGSLETSTLRTIENIKANYMQWLNAGGKKELAKNFKCCISPPIFNVSEDKSLLDMMPPPELHLYLGVVNGIFKHMEKEFKSTALTWAKTCNVERQVNFSGESFNGNNCKQLLSKLDDLRSKCPVGCLKFVQVLSDFRLVADSCFSNSLNPDFAKLIDNFKKSYLDLGISVTPKVHCIFVHVKEFCKKHQVGLGIFSEQAFESVHHEFKIIWKKYKVHFNHPEYDKRLLRAVCEFNGLHV